MVVVISCDECMFNKVYCHGALSYETNLFKMINKSYKIIREEKLKRINGKI